MTEYEKKVKKEARICFASCYLTAIAFRFLLTPVGTIVREYEIGPLVLRYRDIYVFGVRIARIHLTGHLT